jgi:hypothetical protein
MGQTHHTPCTTDFLQAAQQEAAETRASLLWPNTGSTITLRLAYRARPGGVRTFAAMRSLAVQPPEHGDVGGPGP